MASPCLGQRGVCRCSLWWCMRTRPHVPSERAASIAPFAHRAALGPTRPPHWALMPSARFTPRMANWGASGERRRRAGRSGRSGSAVAISPEVQARPRSPVGIASAACYAEPAGGRGRPRLLDGAGGPCHGVFSAQCRAQIVARRFARCRSPWRTESWVCSVPLSFESGVPRARCVADACSPAGSRTTDHRARRTICQLCDDSEDINRSTCVLCEAHYFNTFS